MKLQYEVNETVRTVDLDELAVLRAEELLQGTNMKLNDICEAIGYSDTTQFIRDFKKKYQQTPAKYRKLAVHSGSAE